MKTNYKCDFLTFQGFEHANDLHVANDLCVANDLKCKIITILSFFYTEMYILGGGILVFFIWRVW